MNSADDDLDAPVSGFGDTVGRRHEQLALAAPDRDDVGRRHATADQRRAYLLGALSCQRDVERVGAHRVGVADDHDVRDRALRKIREYTLECLLRILGKLVGALDEVQREMRGAAGLYGKRLAKRRLDFGGARAVRPWVRP